MGRIENDGVKRVRHHVQPKIEPKPKPKVEPQIFDNSGASRKGELRFQGQQQRDRIERLYGAGAASVSTMNDIRLMTATTKANIAHQQTYNKELAAFEAYQKGGAADPNYTGAKSYIEVTQRADAAYRTELSKAGFRPADVHGNSNVKALDFLNIEANRPGNLSTLSADQVRLRVQNGEKPIYLVRLVENRYISSGDSKLSGKDTAWVATADEIAGAKGDLFETMKRIGYKDAYVDQVRQNIQDSKNGILKPGDKNYTQIEDYSLGVMETDGTKGHKQALWNTILDKAKTNDRYEAYNLDKPEFVEKVKNFSYDGKNYDTHRDIMQRKGIATSEQYTANFPKDQKEAFRARFQIERDFGANPLFTGDGTTLREDGLNRGVGGQEKFIDTVPLREQRRTSFMPMRDTGLKADPTSLEVRPQVRNIVDVPTPTTMRGEIKGGAIAGGLISAATSLPQVFDQTQRGDYLGAGRTLVQNGGTGAFVGGVSSAGERFIANGIEQSFSRSGTQLITSGVARQAVSRVAGSSIVGGVVNGGFSAYDQIGAYRRGEVRGSQAVGTVIGETAVGVGAGAAGAAAGAAVGVWFGGVGAVPGAIIGFGVGVAAGFVADGGLRKLGVDKAIARGVTATIDAGSRAVETVQKQASQAVQTGRQYVSRQVTQAKEIYRSASNAAKTARAYVGQRLDNAKQRISTGTRAAVRYVSQAKNNAVNTVRNTASRAVNTARSTVSQARSTVNNTVNQARSTANNIANQARSTVSNAVNNLAGGAVSNLKSVFGW